MYPLIVVQFEIPAIVMCPGHEAATEGRHACLAQRLGHVTEVEQFCDVPIPDFWQVPSSEVNPTEVTPGIDVLA
jgi:hypothetical protein